jgi:hypothetical protein
MSIKLNYLIKRTLLCSKISLNNNLYLNKVYHNILIFIEAKIYNNLDRQPAMRDFKIEGFI